MGRLNFFIQRRLNFIIGFILALIGVVLLYGYIKSEREKITQEIKTAFSEKYRELESILVAKQTIKKGTSIKPSMVESKVFPRQYIEPKAVKASDSIVGMKALVDINQGEQITFSKLARTSQNFSQVDSKTLTDVTPIGKRAVTIKVDEISAVAGMLKPGDYVDVVAMVKVPMRSEDNKISTVVMNIPLFQNVQILAIGQKVVTPQKTFSIFAQDSKRYQKKQEDDQSLVTLALTPQEASLLSFVSEQGKIRLLARSAADGKVDAIPPATWDTFFQYVQSMYPDLMQKPVKPVEQQRKIEVYKGLMRQYIPVSDE